MKLACLRRTQEDLDALQQLANRLGLISDALKNTQRDLKAYGPALGSRPVAHSLDQFVDGWKDGRKKIEENVDKLLDKVKGIAQTYEEQEKALTAQAASSGKQP